MDNMDRFLNIIVFGAGVYLIYTAIIMKTKGEVASGLLGKGIDWSSAKEENKKAYIRIMIPANLILGTIMIVMAAIFTFGKHLGINEIAISIMYAVSFLFLVAYSAVMINYQNKYLK